MPDDKGSGSGVPPSTDDMLNALSTEMGSKGDGKSPEPADKAPEEAPAAAPSPEEEGDEAAEIAALEARLSALKEAKAKAKAEAEAAPDEGDKDPAPEAEAVAEAESAEAEGTGSPAEAEPEDTVDQIASVASQMFSGGDDTGDFDDDLLPDALDDDLDEGALRAQRERSRSAMIGAAVIFALIGGSALYLWTLAQKRMEELDSANVIYDSLAELVTDYDIHQEDIKQWKLKEHNKKERAKIPIYGNIRIESEPQFADVYVECLPRDRRCNNIGTRENPQWADHWVPDEETKEKRCGRDEDCRECRQPTPEEVKAPDFKMRELCSIYDAKCQAGHCFLPIRTATTMQTLFIGTLGGLDKERKYNVRLEKPGWLSETYSVEARDWHQRINPSDERSDRILVKRFDLKPDPMAPAEIRAEVEEYLKKKREAEAAMLQEMDDWQSGN